MTQLMPNHTTRPQVALADNNGCNRYAGQWYVFRRVLNPHNLGSDPSNTHYLHPDGTWSLSAWHTDEKHAYHPTKEVAEATLRKYCHDQEKADGPPLPGV